MPFICAAYPDLKPLVTRLSPVDAFTRALEVSNQLHWVVGWRAPAVSPVVYFEASTRSPILSRDITDLAVRVRSINATAESPHTDGFTGGSVVDIRSRSRDRSFGDFGLNAEVRSARCSRFIST